MEINKVTRNNAISAYLMVGISALFLFNKKNENINNSFVKNHTKSAILIHLTIILNIIFFRFYKVFGNISFYNFSLNQIISNILFIFSIFILFLGAYKAYKLELFKLGKLFSFKSDKNILDVNKDGNFGEKDKVTFIITFIPFLGQIFGAKYNKNENIKEILKLNTFITFIFCLLFINNYNNLNQIFNLIYFIFIAFVGVNLFVKSELLIINLPKYFDFGEIWKNFKIFLIYMKNYFSGNFKEFKILEEEKNKKIYEDNLKTHNEMKSLPELKGPKKIIYLPIINLYFIFFKKNNYQIHIRNGLTISFLIIIFIILGFFKILSLKYLILFLFPICFGLGNLGRNYYKIPFIYDVYEIFIKFLNFFRNSKKFISEKRKEVNEVSIKVGENKENIEKI